MIKVLQVGKYYHPYTGGIETISKILMDKESALNYSCDIICVNHSDSKSTIEPTSKGTVYRCGKIFSINSFAFSLSFFNYFKRLHKQYDVLHLHYPNPLAALAIWLFRPKKKIVIHWHGDIINKGFLYALYKPLEKYTLQKADVIIATSRKYADSSIPLQQSKKKVEVIPIGISKYVFDLDKEKSEKIRARFPGKKIVFALGRLVPFKGFEFLIRCAKYLDNGTVIIIGGGGEKLQEYKRLITELELDEIVFLEREIPNKDVGNYYQACDLFCLPSVERSESFGIVMIEAMSFSKPIVATNIPGSGVSWVNVNEETGLNVAPKDAKALADAINKILNDNELYNRFSTNAFERYSSLFTENAMQEQFENLYKHLASE